MLLKVLHVDFILLDGNEENIFSLRAAAQISESYKMRTEAVVQRYSVKKIHLKISQNSQENACARASFLIKLININNKLH